MEAKVSAGNSSGASCLARYCASLVIAATPSLNHCAFGGGNYVSRRLARTFGREHAWDASQVHGDRDFGPPRLRGEYCAHVFRGIVSQLEDQEAAVAQQVARLVHQALIQPDAGRA